MDEQEPMTTIETEPKCSCHVHKKSAEEIHIKARSTKEEDDRLAEALRKFFKRQASSVLPKIGADSDWWDAERWDKELAEDLEPIIDEIADAHGHEVADALGSEYSEALTREYLKAVAQGRATAINSKTLENLQEALEAEEDETEGNTPAHVFSLRESAQAAIIGASLALYVAGWASTVEAPQQAQSQGINKGAYKVWVTGDNPRPSHEAMNGERVPIGENFSNGAKWPGDDTIGPDETCGCNCTTEVVIVF